MSPAIDLDGMAARGFVEMVIHGVGVCYEISLIVAPLEASLEACYPEWDERHRRYRTRFVRVADVEPDFDQPPAALLPEANASRALYRSLSRIGLEHELHRHQSQGDDVDVDALVRLRVDLLSGHAGDSGIYRASLRTKRELAALVLLDISGSTADRADDGVSVFDRQLALALALVQVLHASGDRVAFYGFHSWGPKIVRLPRLLGFGELPDARMLERAQRLSPVGYSRLGAAIRRGADLLESQAGTPHRLLIVISDAVAYDRGYERSYAHADTRRSIAEARGGNTACVCLSIGASTELAELERVFGGSCFLSLPSLRGHEHALQRLFEHAIAEVSRRRASRTRIDPRV